eukprot:3624383-Pleurochrysis_carterae.AAC.1
MAMDSARLHITRRILPILLVMRTRFRNRKPRIARSVLELACELAGISDSTSRPQRTKAIPIYLVCSTG